jgi:hypothetical protein
MHAPWPHATHNIKCLQHLHAMCQRCCDAAQGQNQPSFQVCLSLLCMTCSCTAPGSMEAHAAHVTPLHVQILGPLSGSLAAHLNSAVPWQCTLLLTLSELLLLVPLLLLQWCCQRRCCCCWRTLSVMNGSTADR